MDAGIPVCFFTFGGYFIGLAQGHAHKNVVLRQAQFGVAADAARALAVAREIVRSKIRNQRVMLRRNHPGIDKGALRELSRLANAARGAADDGVLLGLEGAAAAVYFRHFSGMLKGGGLDFELAGRNRRPPRDPVNALLSYVYSLLCKDATATALAVGLDPYLGMYHRPRYGKPALALDLMEELRPLVGDSVVATVINNGEVRPASFVTRADGCNLTPAGRAAVLGAYERRLGQEIRHPLFGYRASWRRVMEIQARLLGRHLLGEIPRYVPMETR
jgi:CRISPR-associated protein Cas1